MNYFVQLIYGPYLNIINLEEEINFFMQRNINIQHVSIIYLHVV